MSASPARRAKIDALFTALLDLPREARAAHLESLAGNDAELRAAVWKLLHASEDEDPRFEPGAVLAGPLVEQLQRELGHPPELAPGARLGRWRLIQELGRGGMAVVYLAERADGQFEQKAALKLLQPSVASPELTRRFEQERQILASLNHPHIARLLDGGVTQGGHPFLVMEQVQGLAIDHYCDQHRLPVRERLGLCLTVARAVDAAHKQLVVHRDLKPSNVLVAPGGEVKLLDFGIAKLLDESGANIERLSHADLRLLTPQYASPEQLRGESVSMASDAYQLGILLYELLVGRRPYELRGKSLVEAARLVCDAQVARPSAALAADPTAATVARLRRTRPERLARELAGDLDAIVIKALAKLPTERYASAGELAADLERYLAHRPVAARPGTTLYHLAKFAGRHRFAVSTVCAAALAVAGLMVFYTVRLAAERDRARLQAKKATQMADYLAGVFRATDPMGTGGGVKTVRELVDRGTAELDSELAGQPEVEARLRSLLGEVYDHLGDHKAAQTLFDEALRKRRVLFGERHLAVAETEVALGFLLLRTSEFRRARELFERALATQEELLPPDHPDLARTLNGLGFVARVQGRFKDAHALLERAIALRKRGLGPQDTTLAESLQELGTLNTFEKNFAAALPLLERAAEIYLLSSGPEHPRYAQALTTLGRGLHKAGEPAAARAVLEQALSIFERTFGPDHPEVATTLTHLGWATFEAGDPSAGITHLARSQALYEQLLGTDHSTTLTTMNDLGVALTRAGRSREAVPVLRRSLAGQDRSTGSEALLTVPTARNLANALWDAGKRNEARALYARIEAQLRTQSVPEHQHHRSFMTEYGARLPADRTPR